jgi:ring-1,2-phenylacetyl-CoA epoxidase subunit PaaE
MILDFLKQFGQGLAGAFGVMSVAYLIFWIFLGKIFKNRKIQLSKRAGSAQLKDEAIAAIFSGIGGTLFAMLLFSMRDMGQLKLYTDSAKYGIAYEVLTIILLLLASDTWFYWFHRTMHRPSLYKYVHALHHRSLDVNPFTSNSFHVIEAVALTVWVLPFLYFIPVSAKALGIMQALGLFNNLKSHLGYEFFPKFFKYPPFNMLVTATNHSLHHTQYNGNYGLFFRFWDIICGTELNMTNSLFQEIHNRHDAELVDNTKYKVLVISNLVKETDEAVFVYFKPSDSKFYDYEAGQHLTVRVKVNGRNHNRCFSLSSTPADDFLRITVKLKGEVSHWFFNDAKVGDTIEALYPVGDFKIVNSTAYVMVAGGSGITPLYSMIRSILNQDTYGKIKLLYANKSQNSIIFKNEIDALSKQYSNFECAYFFSGQKRITIDDLEVNSGANYFVCGPDSLKESVFDQLQIAGVNKYNIHTEHFVDGYVPNFGLI